MKKLKNLATIFIIGLCLLSGKQAKAQDSDAPKDNVIKWNPFSEAFNTFSLSYEKRLNKKLTVQGTLNITDKSSDANSNTSNNNSNGYFGMGQESGYGIVLDLRYYPMYETKPAPDGFYVGPFVRYQAVSFKDDSTSAMVTRFSIGGTIGYQAIIGNVVTFDFFCGPSIEFITGSLSKQASGYTNQYSGGVAPLTVDDLLNRFNPLLSTTGSNTGFRIGFSMGVAF